MIDALYDEKIEHLLELNEHYIISPFLHIYPPESDFDNLEEYFYKNYIKDYSERVSKIVLSEICRYDSLCYLTEFASEKKKKKYAKYQYCDFRKKGLKKIVKILKYVICNAGTSMNIYIPVIDSLITIGSGFDTVIYSENGNFIKDARKYTETCGLFFLKKNGLR